MGLAMGKEYGKSREEKWQNSQEVTFYRYSIGRG